MLEFIPQNFDISLCTGLQKQMQKIPRNAYNILYCYDRYFTCFEAVNLVGGHRLATTEKLHFHNLVYYGMFGGIFLTQTSILRNWESMIHGKIL